MTAPLIVGIAGGSASGKTTLCEALCDALDELSVRVVHMDTYFLPIKPRTRAPFTGTEWDDYNQPGSFDLETLRRDVDALGLAEHPPEVVLIEGLLTLQDDALRKKLDLRVFVDAPPDERIVRRLRRNMARGLAFDEIASYYLEPSRVRRTFPLARGPSLQRTVPFLNSARCAGHLDSHPRLDTSQVQRPHT